MSYEDDIFNTTPVEYRVDYTKRHEAESASRFFQGYRTADIVDMFKQSMDAHEGKFEDVEDYTVYRHNRFTEKWEKCQTGFG